VLQLNAAVNPADEITLYSGNYAGYINYPAPGEAA